jgi:hypothetical protein
MTRTNIQWVAQVSILRPGCCGQDRLRGETQVSKSRPGPPTERLEVAVFFAGARRSGERSAVQRPLLKERYWAGTNKIATGAGVWIVWPAGFNWPSFASTVKTTMLFES